MSWRSPADLTQQDGRIDVAAVTTLSPSFAGWLQSLCEPQVVLRPQSARAALARLSQGTYRDRGVDSSPQALSTPVNLSELQHLIPAHLKVTTAESEGFSIRAQYNPRQLLRAIFSLKARAIARKFKSI